MKIAEIYASVQGEGLLTGTPSIFVRTSGCNLRCWFCDTPYASWIPEGDDLPVDEIVGRVFELGGEHAVLTGGEPMLHAELVPLARALKQAQYHVTVETAGSIDLPIVCDLVSISPKFASSAPPKNEEPYWHDRHNRSRNSPDVIRRLVRDYVHQVKFVIETPDDCEAVLSYLIEFPEIKPARVLLMPQGTANEELDSKKAWIEAFCDTHGFRFCPRRQIEWFGNARGT